VRRSTAAKRRNSNGWWLRDGSCNSGFFSDSTRSSCLPLNIACAAAEPAEDCLNNRYWVLCDPRWGRQFIDCGD
jgi:hypothetical protein